MATTSNAPPVRRLSTGMRLTGVVGIMLVFIAGFQLFVLSGQTERYFAWTIQPPLSAAFLGAFYWGALAFIFFGGQGGGGAWARARTGMPGVVLFTSLTLVATLLHLDRFHLNAPDAFTVFVTWAWILVYVLVPPALVLLWLSQVRSPGGDPPVSAPLPPLYRIVLGVQAIVLVVLGAGLFFAPQATALLWPWELTPLVARAAGAWLLALASLLICAIWENDQDIARPTAIICVVLATLQFLALIRYPQYLAWDGISAWIYVLFALSVLAAGLYGWRGIGRADQPATPR